MLARSRPVVSGGTGFFMKMTLRDEIHLHLGTDRRWYVVEGRHRGRIIGRPEGYGSHREATRWRRLYRAVRELQQG